ncbi:MAG: hypothetical protein IIY78_09280, partial [Clostridia bacterium]|nr:hypothetical protein [Clostridia bacterium]
EAPTEPAGETQSPWPPEALLSPFRGEFPKQSGGLFWKEGHFGRKCPFAPVCTMFPRRSKATQIC